MAGFIVVGVLLIVGGWFYRAIGRPARNDGAIGYWKQDWRWSGTAALLGGVALVIVGLAAYIV